MSMTTENEIDTLNKFNKMVHKLANQWKREPRISRDDLVSEGNMAIIRALRNFKEERGAKLSTYIYHSIRNAMIAYAKGNRYLMYCSTHNQRKEEECEKAFAQEKNTASLDYPLEDGLSFSSMVEASGMTPLEAASKKEEWEMLESAISSSLDDRERYLVREGNKWFGNKTLEDLSGDFGVSRQRVHQIQQGVFDKLHRKLSRVGGDCE